MIRPRCSRPRLHLFFFSWYLYIRAKTIKLNSSDLPLTGLVVNGSLECFAPFRTAVPFQGQTALEFEWLVPKTGLFVHF